VPDLLWTGLPVPPGNSALAVEEQWACGIGADLPRVPALVSPPLLGHAESRLDKLTLAHSRRVNYDLIAADYDRRFEGRGARGLEDLLAEAAGVFRLTDGRDWRREMDWLGAGKRRPGDGGRAIMSMKGTIACR
jgi:hypothetical protein